MQKLIFKLTARFLIVCLFIGITLQATSQCDVPPFLRDAYERDVKSIAIRRMMEVNSPDTQLITIPQSWQDTIIEGMAAVYNSGIPAADSVFNMYCVHDAVGNPVLHSLIVGVEDTSLMAQAWSEGMTETGDTTIDMLFDTYDFELVSYNGSFGVLETPHLLNLIALGDSLTTYVDGVLYAEPNYIIGLGGQILYDADAAGTRYYDFVYQWNDCFDGCDNYHLWKFMVDPDCEVTYLGFEEGGFFGVEPLPEPGDCMLTGTGNESAIHDNLAIYPNPGPGVFQIESKNIRQLLHASVYDLSGQKVCDVTFSPGDQAVFDISEVLDGMYIVRVETGDGILVDRLVKQ